MTGGSGTNGLVKDWNQCNEIRSEPRSVNRRQLNEWRVHLGHRFATVLPMMPMWRTRHGLAALHGFGRRSSGGAIDNVGREGSREEDHQDCFSEAHLSSKVGVKIVEVKSRPSSYAVLRLVGEEGGSLAVGRFEGIGGERRAIAG